jgi:hypothetical protein
MQQPGYSPYRASAILCLAVLGSLCTSSPAFSDEIPAAELVFQRPAAPASAAVGSEQYRMSVVFELEPCGGLQHVDVPKDARISVCGSRLRGR